MRGPDKDTYPKHHGVRNRFRLGAHPHQPLLNPRAETDEHHGLARQHAFGVKANMGDVGVIARGGRIGTIRERRWLYRCIGKADIRTDIARACACACALRTLSIYKMQPKEQTPEEPFTGEYI